MLSFSTTSHGIVRSALMITLSWLLSNSDDQPLCLSSLRLTSPLQNLNHHCIEHLLAVPGPNVLLFQAVFAALQSILNSNKKIAQIRFSLT